MSALKERLEAADRQVVIRDTVSLIDDEVASKSGLSGMAIKGGYKVVKKLRGGRMIHDAVDHLLDDFTDALAPLYDDFLEADSTTTFERYLKGHSDAACDALLGITDAKIKRAENRVIIKTYNKLRGQAEKHVVDALPGVGRLIDQHAPKE